eukprot:5026355-Amphidinium_carterae.1
MKILAREDVLHVAASKVTKPSKRDSEKSAQRFEGCQERTTSTQMICSKQKSETLREIPYDASCMREYMLLAVE